MRKVRSVKESLFSCLTAVVPFTKRDKILSALAVFLLLPAAYGQHTPTNTTTQVLGTGTTALLGGDLTDPDNNGLDAVGGATDPSWDWASIDASVEPDFEGGEMAFNIFDNKVGAGNDKWCCDDPTVDTPVWVAVQFKGPVQLSYFTAASGNDTPARDPVNWAIQGSNDGTTYTDIYHFQGTPAIWTARNQVIKFTLPTNSPPYTYLRYIAYDTPDPLHQLNEIEYFGLTAGGTFTLSPPTVSYKGLVFSANDTTTSVVDTNSVILTVDTQAVTPTITKTGPGTTITYTPTNQFVLGSQHTFSIEVKDVGGANTVTNAGTFTVVGGYFPLTNLPGPGPGTNLWSVRHVWNVGTVDSLATAISNVTAVGTAAFTGEFFDSTSPDIDFGNGGIFGGNHPYPGEVVSSAGWTGDNFVQFGTFLLPITQEGDYTFGVHSDDGFGLRIRGGEAISVAGAGQLDPNDPEAVVHPGTTGDSDTRAVYHLTPGTNRVEFVWYEAGGGDFGEIYWAPGAITNDAAPGANWKLIGSNLGPTPLLPATNNLPSPAVSNGVWSVRFIFNATDTNGAAVAVNSIPVSINLITNAADPNFTGTVVDVSAPVINWIGGGIFGADLQLPDAVTNATGWTGDNYVMLAVGHIQVPVETNYTFGVHSDDGFALRIPGAEVVSVSGNGRLDIGNTGAVVHPATTGDSSTRAVYHLKQGVYRVEFFYFEATGGDNGELYVAQGSYTNDVDTTGWILLGDPNGGKPFKVLGLDTNGVTVVSSDPGGTELTTLQLGLDDLAATGTGPGTKYNIANVGDTNTNPGVLSFPKDTPADDNDFALRLTGNLVVAETGTYAVGFNSDDGGYMRLIGQTFTNILAGAATGAEIVTGTNGIPDEVACDCLTGDANTFGSVTLTNGIYPFEAVLFERSGGAYIRLKAAELGAPMSLMPALSTSTNGGSNVFTVPLSLGPLTTNAPTFGGGGGGTNTNNGPNITFTMTTTNTLTLAWSPPGGTLQTTPTLGTLGTNGVGTNVTWQVVGTNNPATITIGTNQSAFFRVQQ